MPPGSAFRRVVRPFRISTSGPAFWGLLPAFLFVALVGSTKSVAS